MQEMKQALWALGVAVVACLVGGWDIVRTVIIPGSGTANEARDVKSATDGGFIVAGNQQDGRTKLTTMVKLTAEGEVVWNGHYGRGYAEACAQTLDGGYALAGSSPDFNSVYLARADTDGRWLWSQTISGEDPREVMQGHDMTVTSDGGFIIVGVWRLHSLFPWAGLVVKTDEGGALSGPDTTLIPSICTVSTRFWSWRTGCTL